MSATAQTQPVIDPYEAEPSRPLSPPIDSLPKQFSRPPVSNEPLKDLSDVLDDSEYDDANIGITTVEFSTGIPLHRYPRSAKAPESERKRAAIAIIKECTRDGNISNHLLNEPFLSHNQYSGVFAEDMALLEKLLTEVICAPHSLTEEMMYRLDDKTYRKFKKILATRRDKAKQSLIQYGRPKLREPVWPVDVSDFVTLNDFEIYALHLRIRTEAFLWHLDKAHNFDTWGPRIELDEDYLKEREMRWRHSEELQTPERSPRVKTEFNLGDFRRAATGEPERSSRPADTMRHPSGYTRQGAELLGLHSNTRFSEAHSFGRREHENLRASSFQERASENTRNHHEDSRQPLRNTRPSFDPEPSDDGEGDGDDGRRDRRRNDPLGRGRTADPIQGGTKPAEVHFDTKLKMTDVPTWDGNPDTIVGWLRKVNDLGEWSTAVFRELGRIVPKRLTDAADKWYYSLPPAYRLNLERDWDSLRQGIADYYMNRKWWERQKERARVCTYQDQGYTTETPSEYYIRKSDLLNTAFDLSDSEIISRVMDGAPSAWNTVLTTQLYKTAVEFQASIRYHEEQLIGLDPKGKRPMNSYESRMAKEKRPWIPYNKTARTNLVGASVGSSLPLFPKDDDTKTRRRKSPTQAGARPCRHCGSGEHWDPECKHHNEGMRKARTRLATTDVEELVAQDEYDELYFDTEEQDFEESLRITESESRLVNSNESTATETPASGGVNMEEVREEHPADSATNTHTLRVESDNQSTFPKEYEYSTFPRKQRRALERLQRRFQKTYHVDTQDKGQILELRKHMQRPPGCTFLGSKATATTAGINGLKQDEMKVIVDSGSDITLISQTALQSLSSKPKLRLGQRINLIQVTGQSTISGYVNLDLFFDTAEGPVKLNVDAYVVNGMSTPFILGNDFADQYSISIIRRDGSSYLSFGDSDREVKVENSTAPSTVDSEGRVFKIRVLHEVSSRMARARAHRKSQKMRRRHQRFTSRGEVRSEARVVIPPETTVKVPVKAHFPSQHTSLFIERNIQQQGEGDRFYGSPDSLIDSINPFIHISNFSDLPVILEKGKLVATSHNPRNWLDRQLGGSKEAESETYATFIKDIIKARGNPASCRAIRTETEITSKAHQNAYAEDDPASTDPVEGGPKTAETAPDFIAATTMLSNLDMSPDLSPENRQRLETIVLRNKLAFGLDGKLGIHDARVEVRLKPNSQPVSLPPFPVSPANREVMNKQIDSWIQLGVIEPSESPWAAPAFIVYRNNKPRMVIDYRKLNSLVIPDEFPLPKQDDMMQALSGAQWLTTLDALSGFTQLIVHENSREKLAFRCHRGLWQFTRMPFGYRNGPSVFQRVMQNVLAPFLWIFALVYIDDIVIFSKTFEDHLKHIDQVLKAIISSGITLSLPKCHFAYQSLLLLGQKVSRLGMSTHKEKVEAICELDAPQNVQELQTFLGMMVYFSAYIPFYAWIAHPLFRLLKKDTPWEWTDLHCEAFDLCKQVLSNAPVRGYAIPGLPYRVYTDACDYGLAGILQQVQPIAIRDLQGTRTYDRLKEAFNNKEPVPQLVSMLSKEHNDVPALPEWSTNFEDTIVHVERVVCYWSRVLKSAERNYSPTEREALALKEALIKFQPYIEGEKILAITDHAALTWSRTFQNVNRRLLTWGTVFSAYPNLRVVHRAGRVHSNVDPISRLRRRIPFQNGPVSDGIASVDLRKPETYQDPMKNMYKELGDRFEEKLLSVGTRFVAHEECRASDFAKDMGTIPFQLENQAFVGELPFQSAQTHTLLVGISEDEVKEWREAYQEDVHYRSVLDSFKKSTAHIAPEYPQYFYSDNGLIYFEDSNGNNRLCVPKSLRVQVMSMIHNTLTESAHSGYHKSYNRLATTHYWPGMSRDLQKYVSTCDICQKSKPRRHGPVGLLQPIPIPTRPFEVVSMDFIPELPESSGYNNILVIVDKLTKYAIFVPCSTTINEENTARLFFEHIIAKFGIPAQIITDRDPRWRNTFWKEVCKLMGMKRALTTAHHPQADGQTEVLNQGLEIALRAYIGPERNDWAKYLNGLALSYNSTPHTSTGYAPAYLLFGFTPRTESTLLSDPNFIPRPLGDSVLTGGKPDSVYLEHENDKAVDMAEQFEAERLRAKEALQLSQAFQQKNYNKGRLLTEFEEGELVVLNPHSLDLIRDIKGRGRKLMMRYDGPFEIIRKINPVTYQLRLPTSYGIHPILNIAHLEKYRPSPTEFGQRPTKRMNRDDFEALPEMEIEKIVAERMFKAAGKNRRVKKFRVRWMGLPEHEDEWKTKEELRNAPQILEEWFQSPQRVNKS